MTARTDVFPAPVTRPGLLGIDQVQITYQIFAGVSHPQPSPGPLAETIRSVMELHPDDLRARHNGLQKALHALTSVTPLTETTS